MVFTRDPHWKNQSKPYDGLLMVFCWLYRNSGLRPELLTYHLMDFMKSDGFHLVFH